MTGQLNQARSRWLCGARVGVLNYPDEAWNQVESDDGAEITYLAPRLVGKGLVPVYLGEEAGVPRG